MLGQWTDVFWKALDWLIALLWRIIEFLQTYNGAVTAFATGVIAAFTIALVFVSRRQAKLTRAAVAISNKDFISTHRPRLIVREVQRLQSTIQRNIELRFVVANIGGSDAEIVESHKEVQDIRDGMLRPLQPTEGANPIGRRTIIPGSHIFDECGSTVSVHSLAVSRMIDARRLPRGANPNENRAVCFRGFVIYTDKNGIRLRTGFCRVYDAEAERFYPLDDPDYEYAD